jgi:ribosome production factor 2
MGRIHLGRQDLDELQSRKMKGLKRSRDVRDEAEEGAPEEDEVDDDEEGDSEELDFELIDEGGESDDEDGGVELKKPRLE